MVKVSGLFSGYPDRNVLSEVDMTIPASSLTVIVGPNGCGKSTLLKTLCGILTAQEGEILLDGQNIGAYSPKMLARQVAYLAQSRPIPDITVERLVLHGRFPYLNYPRRYSPRDLQIARDAMERMGVLELAQTPMATLSGGTRQKVYIAMALTQNTPLVLLDEPTTYLDVSHQLQMMEHARFLCREGKAVVMVLHDLSMALQTADWLIVMDGGRVIWQEEPQNVFESRCLDRVFGVELKRVKTKTGWHYYYEGKGGER